MKKNLLSISETHLISWVLVQYVTGLSFLKQTKITNKNFCNKIFLEKNLGHYIKFGIVRGSWAVVQNPIFNQKLILIEFKTNLSWVNLAASVTANRARTATRKTWIEENHNIIQYVKVRMFFSIYSKKINNILRFKKKIILCKKI